MLVGLTSFTSLLSSGGQKQIDAQLMNRILSEFWGRATLIVSERNTDAALELYRHVKQLPRTSTRIELAKEANLAVNGVCDLLPSTAALSFGDPICVFVRPIALLDPRRFYCKLLILHSGNQKY